MTRESCEGMKANLREERERERCAVMGLGGEGARGFFACDVYIYSRIGNFVLS